jgi:ferrous iron transport protein B
VSSTLDYGPDIEAKISMLEAAIEGFPALTDVYNPRWLAIALLEGDESLRRRVAETAGGGIILAQVDQTSAQVHDQLGEDIDTLIADRRYRMISDIVAGTVVRKNDHRLTPSDHIDQVVTHPVFGVPIFLGLMWLVFQMTANVSGIYLDWIDGVISGPVSRWAAYLLHGIGLGGGWLESLLIDGVIAGAGSMLTFVPALMFLYFFIAVLEDTGYMARAAFVMDRLMQMLGLHGKSFIPLVVGFGCSVPGIYATRTLEDRRDRILTGLLVPFMSCSARLPVYVLIGSAFFGSNSGNLVFAMYVLGILVAVGSGLLLRKTLFRGHDPSMFVMELPPFRRPMMKTIWRQVRDRTMGFVKNVWNVIVVASIIVWVLLNLPYHDGKPPALKNSLFGGVSRGMSPVFAPAGFGRWEAAGSLVTGLVAKEVVVSTMGQVYEVEPRQNDPQGDNPTFFEDVVKIVKGFGQASLDTVKGIVSLLPGVNLVQHQTTQEETNLQAALRNHFTPLQAVAFSVFVLLYTPCMATVGVMRQEFGVRWMAFSIVYMLGVAWLAAVLTYQGGLLLGM